MQPIIFKALHRRSTFLRSSEQIPNKQSRCNEIFVPMACSLSDNSKQQLPPPSSCSTTLSNYFGNSAAKESNDNIISSLSLSRNSLTANGRSISQRSISLHQFPLCEATRQYSTTTLLLRRRPFSLQQGLHTQRIGNNGFISSRPIMIRMISTNKNGSGSNNAKDSDNSQPKEDTGKDELASTKSTTNRMESLRTEASKAVRQRVEQVEERLNRVLHDVAAVSTGDQLAVAAIALLLVSLIAAPYVISQMKASNRSYDGLADTDDPVDDFTQLARGEWDSDESNGKGDRVSALENLLTDLATSKALQQAAQQFVLQIINAPEVKQALQRLLLSLWKDLVEDPETVKQVINLLAVAIQDEQVKAAALSLVLDIVAEKEVQASLVAAVQKLGDDNEVQKTLQILLTNTAHTTLNDGEVLDHSMEFATDVLGDDVVQQSAGEALRNTVRHAFRPAATMGLTATGVALMLFGVLALGYARSSEYEARLLDTAARSLQTNAAYGLQRLITWPARQLGRLGAWLVQLGQGTLQALVSGVTQTGGRLSNWIVQGVTQTGWTVWSSLGRSLQHILSTTVGAFQSTGKMIVLSISSLVFGTWRWMHHAWTASNASLLEWSWSVVGWGRRLSWHLLSWVPRKFVPSTFRSLQNAWHWLVELTAAAFS